MPKNWYQEQNTSQSIYRANVDIRFIIPISKIDNPEIDKQTALSILNDTLQSTPDITFNITKLDKIK